MCDDVKVVFSDLDGTLVHYPKEFLSYADIISESDDEAVISYKHTGVERVCSVLKSLTGGNSYISKRTLELIAELRSLGIMFVIITGARSSTYALRRPKLPDADYEFWENGGRKLNGSDDKLDTQYTADIMGDSSCDGVTTIDPEMCGDTLDSTGELWKLYAELKGAGWTVDGRNYLTNFRVIVGKDDDANMFSAEKFRTAVVPTLSARGLATSYNLGKADIYPVKSGKANAARHILALHDIPASQSAALFDDDNDLELGALCGRGYLPGVTHPSVLKALEKHDHWTLTEERGFLGTEAALESIIELVKAAKKKKKQKSAGATSV